MPRGPMPERPRPGHRELMTRLKRRYRASPALVYNLEAAVKAHGPSILPIIADIGPRNEQAHAISIFAANSSGADAMKRLRESNLKPKRLAR